MSYLRIVEFSYFIIARAALLFLRSRASSWLPRYVLILFVIVNMYHGVLLRDFHNMSTRRNFLYSSSAVSLAKYFSKSVNVYG